MAALTLMGLSLVTSCGQKGASSSGALGSDAAAATYVPPGEYDEFYAFISGGFSGQMSVYGLPSGRLLKVIPVFSLDPEKGYGFNEETKPLLNTSFGFVPWDDAHHPELSQTNGETDGRWCFINGNNTPRIARVDLTTFETAEIIEIPNSGGNHSSPFTTENTEYVVAGTRFLKRSFFAIAAKNYLGLAQKTNLCLRHEILFSFFNSNKKLLCNFLLELKKKYFLAARGEDGLLSQAQENRISRRRQRAVF